MEVFRVKYIKNAGYKLLELNKIYTVSYLSYNRISFISISGSFSTSKFRTLNNEELPNIEKRYNFFDEEYFIKHGYVLCMDNTIYPNLKIGDIYKGINIYLKGFETGKIKFENVNGEYYKSKFRTLTEEEAIKYSRLNKLKDIFE